MKQRLFTTLLLILLIGMAAPAQTQQKTKFAIASFGQDPFDTTPANPQYEKVDGNGARYAIIKVTSTNPEDDLRAYRFNFGNLNSLVEEHDGQLWVYVQRNAKIVTISREGFQTIDKHDLGLTIEAGKTYIMQLASAGIAIANQMVMFNVSPANSNAKIIVKSDKPGAREEEFGTINATGMVGKSLPLGTYTYRVIASGFSVSEGRITLQDKTTMHIEPVTLNSLGILSVTTQPEGARLYLNKKYKGRTPFSGKIGSGDYHLKLKYGGYKSSKDEFRMNADENKDMTYSMKKKMFLKPTTGYVFAPFFIGSNNILGVNGGIGAYIHNFNIEVNIPWHFWWNYETSYNNESYELRKEYGISGIDIKLGYGFILWHKFRITPQIGYSLFRAHYGKYYWTYDNGVYERDDDGSTYPIHAFTLGTRMELPIVRHVGFFLTPIVQFRIKNNDLLQYTDDISAMGDYGRFGLTAKNLKNMGRGFYIQMGLYFSL